MGKVTYEPPNISDYGLGWKVSIYEKYLDHMRFKVQY